MNKLSFNLKAFIKESVDVLLNPKSYFSKMKTTGGVVEPLTKALIYGALAGIIGFLWYKAGLGSTILLGKAHGFMTIIWFMVIAIVVLFVGGLLLMFISALCKGSNDYETNVRVTAAVMVLMPFSVLLGFVGDLNVIAGVIVSLAINIFSLYIIYFGLTETLKANPTTAKIVIIVLVVLTALLMIIGIGTKKSVNSLNKNFREIMENVKKD